ncbi:MAG: AbrB/MazE/SpoVT family DNA-binding domain-containing protein [Candidatus Hodarchaeota archaeon]
MTKTLGVSKITRSFQISIPPEVREKLSVDVGDFIAFDENENRIIIRKV